VTTSLKSQGGGPCLSQITVLDSKIMILLPFSRRSCLPMCLRYTECQSSPSLSVAVAVSVSVSVPSHQSSLSWALSEALTPSHLDSELSLAPCDAFVKIKLVLMESKRFSLSRRARDSGVGVQQRHACCIGGASCQRAPPCTSNCHLVTGRWRAPAAHPPAVSVFALLYQ